MKAAYVGVLFFAAAVLAAAAGIPVVGLFGAIAIPSLGVAALGIMLGVQSITEVGFKIAVVAIGVGVAAQSLGGGLATVFADPAVRCLAVGGGVVATGLLVAVLAVQLAAGAVRNAPPPRPARRGRVATREVIVDPEPPRADRQAPASDDEIGLFGGRRGRR